MSLFRLALLAFAALLPAAAARAQIALVGPPQTASITSSANIAHAAAGAVATMNPSATCALTMVPGLPAGTVAGNLLVAVVVAKDNDAINMTGWNTLYTNVPIATYQAKVFWRVATGGDPTTIGRAGAGCDVAIGRISRFTGVNTANPFDGGVGASYQNSATVTTGTITTSVASSMLVVTAHSGDNNATPAPAGFTEAWDNSTTTGTDAAISLKWALQTTAGAKGPYTMASAVDPNHGVLFALRPASALTINVPPGTSANHVMIASIATRPSGIPIRAPAGWTLVREDIQATGGAANSSRMATYYRVATAAEPASYTWGFTGASTGASGAILTFSGVDTANPIDAHNGALTASSGSHTAPSVTTFGPNRMLVGAWEFATSANWTAPGGMTERADVPTVPPVVNAALSMMMATQTQAAAGASGTRTATTGVTGGNQAPGVAQLLALRPLAVIDHFVISHAGSGVACDAQAITITAHDASHNPVDANALLVNLSTTNGRGTWTGIQAGGGTLSDPVPGDGAATYTFAVGSNSVTLLFSYANLATSPETFGFNVSGGGFSETTGTAAVTEDPSMTLSAAGFRFRNVTDGNGTVVTQISGKPSNSGFNAKTLRLQAINTDSLTGACVNQFANQTRTVQLGGECNIPATCAGRQVAINGANILTSNDNGGAGAAAYSDVSLAFDANSETEIVIVYPDAGQVAVHARYDLDTGTPGFEMIGSSNPFVVRPFGIAFRGADADTAIQHSGTAGGTLLAAAGDNFTMTLAAYQWASGEDANNDGIPDTGLNITDNGTVPNFATTVSVTPSANLPGVAAGAVSRGPGCAAAASIALSGGAATAADWCYSEAGNVLLAASVTDYLAPGVNISGSSGLDGDAGGGYVGRFKPKFFSITGVPTLANRSDLSCAPASVFTYMNEELTLGFTLEARNTQGAITQNYNGAYAKLNLATAAGLNIGASSGATNLTGRVDSSLAPAGAFANGVASLSVRTAIRRASPDNPDGPYAGTQFGIAPNDGDPDAAGGVQMGTLDLDVDGNAVSDHFAVGPTTEARFGRLWLQNAYGNGASVLPVPIQAQYWNGSAFAVNAADSCTALARSAIALAFGAPLAPCNTAVNAASVPFASGVGTLVLSAPGAGAQGSVLLTPNLGTAGGSYCDPASYVAAGSAPLSYLLGRWNDADNPDGDGATAYDDKPGGRAIFGRYAQPRNFIFYRENY
jgi:hypothetical protein